MGEPDDRGASAVPAFGERLAEQVQARESQIVLGLDPDPMTLWPGTIAPADGTPARRAAAAVTAHCRALIDAAGPACVAVKPQLARFEALGPPGWEALQAVCAHARDAGLLVIADGKRGDIDVTAGAYATALFGALQTPFGPVPGLAADMATVNPLMGADAIEPFVRAARAAGAGVLLLVRTSNRGAAGVQDAELAGGGTVWERLARQVDALGRDAGAPAEAGGAAEWVGTAGSGRATEPGGAAEFAGASESGVGRATRLDDVGAVMGATEPLHLARARELMPRAVFLLPGVGAQGGRVEELAPAFAPGRAAGLIAVSRSIAAAHLKRGGTPAGGDPAAAARAEAERLRALTWSLCG
jgi:orotidine-5'-phosphate decarboxylase